MPTTFRATPTAPFQIVQNATCAGVAVPNVAAKEMIDVQGQWPIVADIDAVGIGFWHLLTFHRVATWPPYFGGHRRVRALKRYWSVILPPRPVLASF